MNFNVRGFETNNNSSQNSSYLIVRAHYLPSHIKFSNCPAKLAVYVLVAYFAPASTTYYVLQRGMLIHQYV